MGKREWRLLGVGVGEGSSLEVRGVRTVILLNSAHLERAKVGDGFVGYGLFFWVSHVQQADGGNEMP